MSSPRIGYVVVDTWAGRHCHIVEILRETAKRYWIRWRSTVCARKPAGSEQFIAKNAVRENPPAWAVGGKSPT